TLLTIDIPRVLNIWTGTKNERRRTKHKHCAGGSHARFGQGFHGSCFAHRVRWRDAVLFRYDDLSRLIPGRSALRTTSAAGPSGNSITDRVLAHDRPRL